MPDYWITTHWPTPRVEPGLSRHVYVKDGKVSLPKLDDIIFFRYSCLPCERATVFAQSPGIILDKQPNSMCLMAKAAS